MPASPDWPETLVATHSGLRGRLGVDLTPGIVGRVVRSFVTLLRQREALGTVVLARDGRPAGRELAACVAERLLDAGVDVVDLGAVPTPTAKLAARSRGAGGAIVVTASHLGPEWNGLKLVAAPGYLPLDVRDLLRLAEAPAARRGRSVADSGAAAAHADAICAAVDVQLIRSASLRVACSGGVGELGPALLDRLGCERAGAVHDVGLVLDEDGDRLRLVDETGSVLDAEVVLPLVAEATGAASVVKGADTSRMVDEVVRRSGGAVTVVSPGELHLVEALVGSGAELAGEGNGGVVVVAVGRARDALAAGALVLEHVARVRRPLSALAAELPRFVRHRSAIACGTARRAAEILDALAARVGLPGPGDPEVGLTIDAGAAWALVRRSATEHVVRLTVEGLTEAAVESLRRELEAGLRLQPGPA